MNNLFGSIMSLIQRDLRLALRSSQEYFNPLLFFIIVISLFPLAISPATKTLQMLAPGVIWVAALLATLLSLQQLFHIDYEDGSLEQLLLCPHSLPLFVLIKILNHWLLSGLPLIILSPLLAMMLMLPIKAIFALMLSLLLGTPLLSLLGAIAAALTVGLRSSNILLSLLILPLYIPILIFGSGTVMLSIAGLPYAGYLALLGALLILGFTLAPFAVAASLRICINY